METGNQTLTLQQPATTSHAPPPHSSASPSNSSELDTSNTKDLATSLSLHTRNKRKNFNPRFTSATDSDHSDHNQAPNITELKIKIGAHGTHGGFSDGEKESSDSSAASSSSSSSSSDEHPTVAPPPAYPNNNVVDGINPATGLSLEAESKFRDFAFKTMQELLNIYGLSLTFNDVLDAFKQQQQKLQQHQRTGE